MKLASIGQTVPELAKKRPSLERVAMLRRGKHSLKGECACGIFRLHYCMSPPLDSAASIITTINRHFFTFFAGLPPFWCCNGFSALQGLCSHGV